MMTSRNLGILRRGEQAIVEQVMADRSSAKRLADMGFVRGARLEMLRPGAPCIVRIDGTCVGLGRAHQSSIRLDPARSPVDTAAAV